jgi:hypothetical protein
MRNHSARAGKAVRRGDTMGDPSINRALTGLAPRLKAIQQPSRRRFLRYALGVGATVLAARAGVARADPIDYSWVITKRATPLHLDVEGTNVHWLPRGVLLRVRGEPTSPRVWAWCPAFATFGTVETSALEDAPAPSETDLEAQRVAPMLPPSLVQGELPARIVGSANVRLWPEARPDTLLRQLNHNAPVRVVELVQGEDGEPWYRLNDDVAGGKAPRGAAFFVHNSFVRVPRVDFHPTSANPDRTPPRWFEADLVQPAILTAYEDGNAIWSSLALHGRKPDLTPEGDHKIIWRVARETMTSERVYPPIPRNAPGGYYLENVLYTQYFSSSGAAIHYNYWSSNWGYSGSHGCLGLPLAESKWAWDWAQTGTPVVVFA